MATRSVLVTNFVVVFLCIVQCQADEENSVYANRELIPLEAPENLTFIKFEGKEVLIKWDRVDPKSIRGTFRGYMVRVWNHVLSQVYAIPPEVTTAHVEYFPFSKNFITVSATNEKYVGPRSTAISFDAPQTEPSLPHLFEYHQLGSESILLQWSKPYQPNGILVGYNVYVTELIDYTNSGKTTGTYFVKGPDHCQAKLTGMALGAKYKVEVGAVNCAGESEHNVLEIELEDHVSMPPSMPSFRYKINDTVMDGTEYFEKECRRQRNVFPNINLSFDDLDDNSYVLNGTEGNIVTAKPRMEVYSSTCLVPTLIQWIPDINKNPGENFYVKYRMKGEQDWQNTTLETDEDYLHLEKFNGCKNYEIILVAVDGEFETESEIQETPAVLFMLRS